MSKDNSAVIKIKANTEEASKNLKKISNQMNGLEKQGKTATSKFAQFGSIASGAQAGISMLSGAIQKVSSAVNECMELYDKQAQAETQLSAAAKNNPYLDEANVVALKNYASQLQEMSTFGDEELIPMMAQLAASGRTQAEIQDIMSAAIDVAASGAMSLDSAVKNLDKTYSGLSGELGESNSAIKALTTEQLKNGDAVRIIKSQYEGMAGSVATATGGWKQFQNTLGDFKEAVGKNFSEAKNSAGQVLNSFFSKIVSGMTRAGKAAEEFKGKLDLIAKNDSSSGTISSFQTEIDQLKSDNAELQKIYEAKTKTRKEYMEQASAEYNDFYAKYIKQNGEFQAQIAKLQSIQSTSADPSERSRAFQQMQEVQAKANDFARESQSTLQTLEKNVKSAKKEYSSLASTISYTAETAAEKIQSNSERIEVLQQKIDDAKKAADTQDSEREKADRLAESNRKVLEIQKEYMDTMESFDNEQEEQRIALEMQGEAVDELSMAQERYTAQIEAYAKARVAAGALMSENNPWVKAKKDEIKASQNLIVQLSAEEAARQNALSEDAVDALNSGMKELADNTSLPAEELTELAQAAIEEAEVQLALLDPQTEGYEKLAAAIENAKNLMAEFGKTGKSAWDEMTSSDKIEWAVGQMNQLSQGVSDALSLMTETLENQETASLTELENLYDKGEISEEEYYEKKEKLEEASAKKKYKVELANWALNLLMTQSSAALAIAKCFEQGPILGPVSAAVMGACTAAQLAAQIAAKPVPPSFATGGIVQGSSYSGDNVRANVNSGEMILNARQQRELWETANGNSSSGGNKFNINVNNSASDTVSASVVPSSDGFSVAIKKIVSDAMANGELNDSYQTMRAGIYGRRITN